MPCMRRHPGWIGLLALALAWPLAGAELTSIFNGTDLAGWKVCTGPNSWRVEGGILIGASDPQLAESHLCTEELYQDFVLELEVRWQGEIDSGVLFRDPTLQVQFGVSRS